MTEEEVPDMPDQPQVAQPESPTPPTPMTVDIDWNKSIASGGGFDVNEIAATPLAYGGKAVLQLDLRGSVTAPGGSVMSVRISNGTSVWKFDGMQSSDYASADCGTWQASSDPLHGLVCTIAAGATSTTKWSYSMADLFDIHGTPDSYSYAGTFHIEVFDGSKRIDCRDLTLEVSHTTTQGGESGFTNAACQ